ncbi:MAG: hypothetical protein WC683_07555 [bacterium]
MAGDYTLIRKIGVEVVGDIEGLKKSYEEAIKDTEQIAGQFTDIGKDLMAVGKEWSTWITAPLAAAGAASIKLASDAEEVDGRFRVAFGSMADEAEAWATTLGDSVGRATTSIKDMAGSLQASLVALGLTRTAAAGLSEQITELALDFAAFYNVADDDALATLQKAVLGGTEALRRYGIVLTDDAMKQELLSMGVEGGIEKATELEKAQARLNLILAKTADVHGEAARNAGTFSGQLKALTADVQEQAEAIGAELMPYARQLVEIVRDLVARFANLSDGTKSLILVTAALAAAVGPVLLVTGSLIESVGKLVAVYKVYQATTFAATAATKGFTVALAANPAGLVAVGIGLLVAAVVPLAIEAATATRRFDDLNRELNDTRTMAAKTGDELRKMAADLRAAARDSAVFEYQVSDTAAALGATTETIRQGRVALADLGAQYLEQKADVKDFADAVTAEMEKADQAYYNHQNAVNKLTDEYDKLKTAIDRALGIEEDLDDQSRTIARSKLRQADAEDALADAIKERDDFEREMYATDYKTVSDYEDAQKTMEILKRNVAKADLDLADAIDGVSDAERRRTELVVEQSEVAAEMGTKDVKTAQTRLEEIKKAIDEETAKMQESNAEREQLQALHLMAVAEAEKLYGETSMNNWATIKKFIEENPILAKTYNIEYDAEGNASWTPPTTTTVTLAVPELKGLELPAAAAGNVTAANGTMTGGTSKNITVTQNLTINAPTTLDPAMTAKLQRQNLQDLGTSLQGVI